MIMYKADSAWKWSTNCTFVSDYSSTCVPTLPTRSGWKCV